MLLNTPLNHKLSIYYYNTDVCEDPSDYRSSRPEVFCKKCVLRNFAKFTGRQLCHSLFLNKVAGLRQQELSIAKLKRLKGLILFRGSEVVVQRCSVKKLFLEIAQNSQENTFARVFLSKKRLWYKCFPVNFAQFLRTAFFS